MGILFVVWWVGGGIGCLSGVCVWVWMRMGCCWLLGMEWNGRGGHGVVYIVWQDPVWQDMVLYGVAGV